SRKKLSGITSRFNRHQLSQFVSWLFFLSCNGKNHKQAASIEITGEMADQVQGSARCTLPLLVTTFPTLASIQNHTDGRERGLGAAADRVPD
ncbi:unnamed protein product, partial [Heterotrigona itama]